MRAYLATIAGYLSPEMSLAFQHHFPLFPSAYTSFKIAKIKTPRVIEALQKQFKEATIAHPYSDPKSQPTM
jgi:hypothetical protein